MKIGKILSLLLAVIVSGLYLAYGFSQEVPVGTVRGKVVMAENGKPLVGAEVLLMPNNEYYEPYGQTPKVEEQPRQKSRRTTVKADGSYEFRNVIAGLYSVQISSTAHKEFSDQHWVAEGQMTEVNAKVEPVEPFLNMYASQHICPPGTDPEVELSGFVPSGKFQIHVYQLDPNKVANQGGLREAVSPLAHPEWGEKKLTPKDVATEIKTIDFVVKKRDIEGAFVEDLDLPQFKEGIYFITCGSKFPSASVLINVTKIALVTKTSDTKGLAYVTDITSGKPLAGVEVRAAKGSYQTNEEGIANFPWSPKESKSGIIARQGDSVAVVGIYGREDLDEAGKGIVYGYTERPIYRPGDLVQFKGILRQINGQGYRLPDIRTATIEVRDPDNALIEKKEVPVTPHGTFSGSFTTSREAKPGGYAVRVAAGSLKGTIYADLAAYRKPDYTIETESTQPYFVLGDKASVKVKCAYYFGGPVVGAKVKANIYRSPDWSGYGFEGDEDPYEYESSYHPRFGGGEFTTEQQVTTNADGEAVITFDTRAKDDPDQLGTNFTYSVNVEVVDVAEKSVYETCEVSVTRGAFNLGVRADKQIVSPTDAIPITVKTMLPGKDKIPVKGQVVDLEIGREEWTGYKSDFLRDTHASATTGADGVGHTQISPLKPGYYSIKATSLDEKGRKVTAEGTVYVAGSKIEADGAAKEGSFNIVLEKKKFDVGDRAKVLLTTDKPGGSALVTVEADEVLYQKVVPMTSPSQILEIPIEKEFGPNASFCVSYVRDRKFLRSSREIVVDRKDHDLVIDVKADKAEYLPGGKALLSVKTTDHTGKPVSAELSLAVVDESIYAIKEDETNLKSEFYPHRYRGVQTNYSFPEIYLDGGDKGGKGVLVRTKFKDTAFFAPHVVTGPDGTASVTVDLPDNLTEWRVTAIGISDDSLVGQKTSKFLVRKPLMVRVLPPTFLVQGDEQHMSVQVVNHTGRDADVNLSMESSGAELTGAEKRVVRVAKDASEAVDLVVSAKQAGTAQVTAKAWISGGASDGERKEFPVQPHGRLQTQTQSGEITGRDAFDVSLLPNAPRGVGSLKIFLSPTIATSMVQALDDLVDFPYGCVEQTMSRFGPAVDVARLLKETGLKRPDLDAKIPLVTKDGYARLARMQHSDGGWGWWENDKSDPFMTAFVLEGVDRASKAGYPARFLSTRKAVGWLESSLKKPANQKAEIRDRYYSAYVLSLYGRGKAVAAELDNLKLTPLGASQNAMAALAYGAAGGKYTKQRDEALDTLVRMAEVSGPVAHWKEEDWSWCNENTALALYALLQHRPNNPLTTKAVVYLMQARRGSSWASTRETSYVLGSLALYYRTHPTQIGDRTVNVLVNGKTVKSLQFTTSSLTSPDMAIEVPLSDLRTGKNRVEIVGGAGGYYTATLRQYDVRDSLPAIASDGLKVTRNYYVLKARPLENGTLKLLPSEKPIEEAERGDIVRCVIDIETKTNREFFLIEDPIPSNCRVTERDDPRAEGESWNYWWSDMTIRDDRIAYFARNLIAGKNQVAYTFKVERRGKVRAMPTVMSNMYDPSQMASSSDNRLEVTR